MNIDGALILSAGLGTRMGEVGKIIPKPLWPLFETRLINFQIAYLKKLGIKKVFVNTHYLSEKFKEANLDAVIMHEEELLLSGGPIVRISKEYKELKTLLVVNSDIFYFFDKSYYEKAIDLINGGETTVLFGLDVTSRDSYNEIVIENDRFIEIEMNPKKKNYITYSGCSLINCQNIIEEEGPHHFFSSVGNPSQYKVSVVTPKDSEYWDFGTLKLYYENSFELLSKKDSNLFKELKNFGMIDESKISSSASYNSSLENVIKLFEGDLKTVPNKIYMNSTNISLSENKAVVFGDTISELD